MNFRIEQLKQNQEQYLKNIIEVDEKLSKLDESASEVQEIIMMFNRVLQREINDLITKTHESGETLNELREIK